MNNVALQALARATKQWVRGSLAVRKFGTPQLQ